MAEHVGAAIIVHDETKAARGDPSSYFSCSHRFLSQTIVRSSEFCETPPEHRPASAHHQQSCAAPLVTVERDCRWSAFDWRRQPALRCINRFSSKWPIWLTLAERAEKTQDR